MKLLIVTQIMDKNDDLLGFMQDWVFAMAKQAQQVTVICLKKGENDLPENVQVISLKKEKGSGKIKRLWLFYKYIFAYKKQYDAVFVHMNPIYVVLGGLFWRMMDKKVSLWFAHYHTSILLRLANFFTDIIFTSTAYACRLQSKKIVVVGQGIDTKRFAYKPRTFLQEPKLLFLGRISSVKELDVLIDALSYLTEKSWHLDVVGAPLESSKDYFFSIREKVENLQLSDRITFYGKVANAQTVAYYRNADYFVNLTRSGSFDKTTLEAMSTGCIPVVSNTVFCEIFPQDLQQSLIFSQSQSTDLSEKLTSLFAMNVQKKERISSKMSEIIRVEHSTLSLSRKIYEALKA